MGDAARKDEAVLPAAITGEEPNQQVGRKVYLEVKEYGKGQASLDFPVTALHDPQPQKCRKKAS
jgi:hypothetical protein